MGFIKIQFIHTPQELILIVFLSIIRLILATKTQLETRPSRKYTLGYDNCIFQTFPAK